MDEHHISGASMPFYLPSHIRPHRKRWTLSQREIAFLLGLSSQAVVSQHETHTRTPESKILLKYEGLFGVAAGELFPKLRWEAEHELMGQAKRLIEQLDTSRGLSAARKLELLTALIRRLDA